MDSQDLQRIERQIGYNFKNTDLLQQAFIRRSYSKEEGGENNEVLEFIGDKVLDIAVVKMLIEKFGFFAEEYDGYDEENDCNEFCCEYSEGELTELKRGLVERKMLASRIDDLELVDYLIMGKGDWKNHVEQQESVKEDLFEAILGAVTLDSNWNWKEIQSTVEYMLDPESYLSDGKEDNYVQLIQEWSLKKNKKLPWISSSNASYGDTHPFFANKNEIRFYSEENDLNTGGYINVQEYYKTHFKCELILDSIDKKFVGFGKSKSAARKIVCKGTYEYLIDNDLFFTIQDEIENPNRMEAINQLETLARRGYFSIPTYEFEQTYDKNGNPTWKCECHIREYDYYYFAKDSSKKEAKKTAAFSMLKYVLEIE